MISEKTTNMKKLNQEMDFLTNFDVDSLPFYAKAIELFNGYNSNSKNKLEIREGTLGQNYSLWSSNFDTGIFWAIYYTLKEIWTPQEETNMEKFAKLEPHSIFQLKKESKTLICRKLDSKCYRVIDSTGNCSLGVVSFTIHDSYELKKGKIEFKEA